MKRLIVSLIVAAVTALSVFCFPACVNEQNGSSVTLVNVSAAEVGTRTDIDYFVMAEPAASVNVNAIEGLNFSGDLQALYGGENGYPQAVAVIKNKFLNYDTASCFKSALAQSGAWLLSESTSVHTIVSAVNSHVASGETPTLNEKNLTKQVIKNCGVNFSNASEQAEEIKSFMQKLNGVSGTSFGLPADDFFLGEEPAEEKESYNGEISVYMPDGAPALGMAKLMSEADSFYNGKVRFNVVNATAIQTYVAGNSPQADICVLPVNAAVKLLGDGEKYKLLGTLTHGNLYIVSNGKPEITLQNISLLKGKTVGVVNLSQVPGLTFKLILKNNNLDFEQLS